MADYSTIKVRIVRPLVRILTVTYHFFISSDENGKVPYLLGPFSFGVLAALGMALILLPAGGRSLQFASLSGDVAIEPAEIVDLVNTARIVAGLLPLEENTTLVESATLKARDILENQYFGHFAPDGTSPWELFRSAGYEYRAAGENLALDFVTAEEAHEALMASPTHRANILSNLYSEVGVAVLRGVFEGHPSVVIVEHFGNPLARVAGVPAHASEDSLSIKTETQKESVRVEMPTAEKADSINKEDSLALAGDVEEKMEVQKIVSAAIVPVSYSRATSPKELLGSVMLRLAGAAVVFLVLIAFVLGLMRGAIVSRGLVFRTVILLVIFGYITLIGVGGFSFGELTQEAFFTVRASTVTP